MESVGKISIRIHSLTQLIVTLVIATAIWWQRRQRYCRPSWLAPVIRRRRQTFKTYSITTTQNERKAFNGNGIFPIFVTSHNKWLSTAFSVLEICMCVFLFPRKWKKWITVNHALIIQSGISMPLPVCLWADISTPIPPPSSVSNHFVFYLSSFPNKCSRVHSTMPLWTKIAHNFCPRAVATYVDVVENKILKK